MEGSGDECLVDHGFQWIYRIVACHDMQDTEPVRPATGPRDGPILKRSPILHLFMLSLSSSNAGLLPPPE